nr:PAC motif-containing protein [Tanacetum cinerariifolium]
MDVKTTFLNGILKDEVYVGQPSGFVSQQYPDHVYALDKDLYGLKQVPRAWLRSLERVPEETGITLDTLWRPILALEAWVGYIHAERGALWNRAAENLYGYTAAEAYGRTPTKLLTEPKDAPLAEHMLKRTVHGEYWCGEFPIINKSGERFVVLCANTPFLDDTGRLTEVIRILSDSRPFQEVKDTLSQAAKVDLKVKTGMNYTDRNTSASDYSRKGFSWPWKENKGEVESIYAKLGYFGWHQLNVIQAHKPVPQMRSSASAELDCQLCVDNYLRCSKIEPSGMWLSARSSSSATGSINSNAIIEVNRETNNLDYEILWEDLIAKERIGQGSCGTVYHGLWYGSDVAIKLFVYQEYSDDLIISFKNEVSMMKRLRHPNILLFIGALTSPQHLCIVRVPSSARGMNYLHHCTPPIVHSDLKSSNLLVYALTTLQARLDFVKVFSYYDSFYRCDVYSYGVVLWELTTEKVPWDGLN